MASPDGPLAVSRRRLSDAVRGLVDPVTFFDGGVFRSVDSVYVRLRGALRGRPTSTRRVASSRLPCNSAVLSLLVEMDRTVAGWDSQASGTVLVLRDVAERDRRPQDCTLLDSYSATVEGWLLRAAELLGDRPVEVALRLPCPSCGRQFVYRINQGENVRSWALRVSESGARCQGCDASWPPSKFEFLARLLGLPALPGN